MNKDLENIIKTYATKTHKDLSGELLDHSKDSLISLFVDLLTMYINDKNSSTIREFLTVSIAGYEHNTKKIGFNGYRHSTTGTPINCEAKPKNLCTQDFYDYNAGIRTTKPSKLNGTGNFTDYTWSRLKRDKLSNLNMLVSGFIDGKLIYILEFPFNTESFVKNLEAQLERRFPNGDESGQFLRSANFSFKNFCSTTSLKLVYTLKPNELKNYSNYLNNELYKYLMSVNND